MALMVNASYVKFFNAANLWMPIPGLVPRVVDDGAPIEDSDGGVAPSTEGFDLNEASLSDSQGVGSAMGSATYAESQATPVDVEDFGVLDGLDLPGLG